MVVDSRREVTFPTCNTDNKAIVVSRTRSKVTCFILSDIVTKCTAVDQRSFMVTIISMFKECQRSKSDKNKQKSGAAKKRSARHEVLLCMNVLRAAVQLKYMKNNNNNNNNNTRKKTSQLLHYAGREVQDIFKDIADPDQANDNQDPCAVCIRKLDHHFRAE